jgi:glycosyltransferase involved in cell wall biosynthesis
VKVLYYTQTHFLDTALPRIQALSNVVELDVFLEIAPNTWQSGIFDVGRIDVPSPLVDADRLLGDQLSKFRQYWLRTRSFTAVVHDSRRSISPKAWLTSRKARRLLLERKPDIIHFDDVSLRAAWMTVGQRLAPTVVSIHDPQPHDNSIEWRDALARRLVSRKADAFIVHNASQRAELAAALGIQTDHVTVIPLGVLDIFRCGRDTTSNSDGKTILFFGRIAKYKGLDVLYDAAREISEQVADLRVIVAGRPIPGYRPPPPPTLANGGTVQIFDRYIDNDTAARLFSAADAVVCPYRDATQSGVVLTAYAFGKPVVASRVGGLPEYVDDGLSGYLVSPGNSSELATKLIAVLESNPSSFRAHIGELRQNRLSWVEIAAKTTDLYKRVLNS